MDFAPSARVRDMQERLTGFMEAHVYPNEGAYREQIEASGQRHHRPRLIEELKERAREAGLWNLFLPDARWGAGLGNLEYAPLAGIMGRVVWASEVFNCSAPDT